MSNELRHGPVTMHRAVERKIMQQVNARPADTPRQRPTAEADEPPAAPERTAGSGTPREQRRPSHGARPQRGAGNAAGNAAGDAAGRGNRSR